MESRAPCSTLGCGPGRHLHELSGRGVYALGVDLSAVAVDLACSGGARAMVADIFGDVPGAGSWRTALLLDGNIGIGGDPVRLLTRLRSLLTDEGVALVELDPTGIRHAAAARATRTGGGEQRLVCVGARPCPARWWGSPPMPGW